MELSKFCLEFHDGEILNIQQDGKTVKLLIESSYVEILTNDPELKLTEDHTYKGNLILKEVTRIVVDRSEQQQIPKLLPGFYEILDLLINENSVRLLVNHHIMDNTKHDVVCSFWEFDVGSVVWENFR